MAKCSVKMNGLLQLLKSIGEDITSIDSNNGKFPWLEMKSSSDISGKLRNYSIINELQPLRRFRITFSTILNKSFILSIPFLKTSINDDLTNY